MSDFPLTVIIVSFKSFDSLQRCLDDWLRNPQCRIIVVDNASPDDTAAQIRQHYPQVELIAEPINHGYGGGANIALKRVTTPFALLLNPDVKMSESDARRLVNTAEGLGEMALPTGSVTKQRP